MRNNMKQLILFTLMVLSLSAAKASEKNQSPCLDSKRAQRLMRDFKWSAARNDHGEFVVKKDLCDQNGLFYKVLKALITMEDLPALSKSQDETNSEIFGEFPIKFFRQRVKEIVFDRSDSENCNVGNTIAYTFTGESAIYICPILTGFSTTSIMGTLIHESRHVDGYEHQICEQGTRKGESVCDQSFEERGAYGVAAEFNVRLSRTSGVDPVMRAEARTNAVATLLDRFNQLPLGIKEGVFAQAQDRRLLFLADKTVSTVMNETPAGIMVLRYGLPSWFSAEEAQFTSFNLTNQFINTDGALADEFRSTLSATQRFSIKDIYYGYFICPLREGHLKCYSGESEIVLDLPGKALGFLSFENSLGVQMENGDIYVFPKDWESIKSYKNISDLTRIQGQIPYRSYVWWKEGISFVLPEDGILRASKDADGLAHPIEAIQGLRFDRVVGPALWSKKLKEL